MLERGDAAGCATLFLNGADRNIFLIQRHSAAQCPAMHMVEVGRTIEAAAGRRARTRRERPKPGVQPWLMLARAGAANAMAG
jgi:hypothetical protein